MTKFLAAGLATMLMMAPAFAGEHYPTDAERSLDAFDACMKSANVFVRECDTGPRCHIRRDTAVLIYRVCKPEADAYLEDCNAAHSARTGNCMNDLIYLTRIP